MSPSPLAIGSTTVLGATVVVALAVGVLGALAVRGHVGGIEEFVSARDSAGGGTLTATLVASSMGAWILLSPAEAGAAFGGITAVAGYALGSALPLAAYAFVGPRIRQLIPDGHSLTEYAYARYGAAMYAYVLVVTVLYMFVFLAAEMTGITLALDLVADVPPWQTAGVIGAVVLAYTAYGGLRASMLTDAVQTLLILPLLAVGFAAALFALGGTGAIHGQVAAANPSLLDPTFGAGLQFGVYVAVAVTGAEMLNQAWWQRIYAADSERTLRRSFGVAAVAVVPMVFLAGLFGIAAQGLGLPDGQASVAFFYVVTEVFPDPVVLAIVVLAVLLVMSSADTLFNAIASVVTVDLPRLVDLSESALTNSARLVTVVVALGATVIGAQGYSVLTVFLTADLLAAATFVPLLAGLYSRRLTGGGALVASLAGLAAGGPYFLVAVAPDLAASIGLPGALPLSADAPFLLAFLGAAGVSAALTAVAAAVSGSRFDLADLDRKVRRLDAGAEPATDGGPETATDGGRHVETASAATADSRGDRR